MACLNSEGWSAAENPADADIIIVNSCGFIESAKRESINAVVHWRSLFPGKKILLAGCLSQRYAKDLAESLVEADGFFGTDDISKISCAVNSLFQKKTKPVHTLNPSSRPLLSLPGSAYIKISEGCNNNCSYCAIPLIRGPLRCRTAADIVKECSGFLERGIKELCIIGQDISSYQSGNYGLPELLNAIANLKGNFWVRLLYMHPDHFPMKILDIMENDSRFLPYFDIPFQHASKKILSAMNRHGTAENYLELAQTIRNRLPNAVIRSTFLLGFPGETDADFTELLDFQEKIRLDWLGCFCYSREEGTAAYGITPRVAKKIAAQRKQEIERRQICITENNINRFIGRKLDVLLEEYFPGDEAVGDFWLGRLYCHAPDVDGSAVLTGKNSNLKTGCLYPCRIIARRGIDLEVATII